jgi:S1-C subfamily serine protease
MWWFRESRPDGYVALLLGLLLSTAFGCTHALQVQNLPAYQEPLRLERPLQPPRIGIQPYTGPNAAFFFFNALVEQLATSPAVEEVRTNYVAREDDSFLPDLVLSIDHRLQYRSSGWNFLVNWPGFAVFMPAWIGYGYHAEIETRVTILDAEGALVAEKTIPMAYRMRHADMDRTVWAGLGWAGLYGVTAFGGGVYDAFVFDDDVIGAFQAEVRDNYSLYTANRVIDQIAALGPVADRSTGNCFAVDRHGTLLTALKVVEETQEIRVLLPSGEWWPAEVVQKLEAEDLAVLRLGRVTRGFLPVAARGVASIGLPVSALAHPGQVSASVQPEILQGEIRAFSGSGPARRLDLTESLDDRYAGSPVLNEAGQIVGVVVSPAAAGQPARAVSIDVARRAVDSFSEGLGSDEREQGLRRARSALCFVEARR